MVNNTNIIDLPCWDGEVGSLVAIEAADTIPFSIERVYYIFGVEPSARRGFHSHRDLEQVLICVNGSVDILVEDGIGSDVVTLDDPREGLYIGPLVWREMFNFSPDAALLVLASRHYAVDDYIRDHSVFEREAQAYFSTVRGGKR
jgi:uncharacterized RmlC-like cupin family protein